jgi:hypothetical protein
MKRLMAAITAVVSVALWAPSAEAATAPTAPQDSCPTTAPVGAFSANQMRELSARYVRDGVYRVAGTQAHEKSVAWLKHELEATPGVTVSESRRGVPTWEPRPHMAGGGADLAAAGTVFVRRGGKWQRLPVAGAVPLSLPTGRDGIGGKLAVIGNEPITADNAKGRVVVLDLPSSSIPYALLGALSWYQTPDMADKAGANLERPFLVTDLPLGQRLVEAGRAGAAGVIVTFDVPREQVAGYFDPHTGVNFTIPAVFAGVDEREQLKALAAHGADARVAVRATRGTAQAPTLDARLSGAQGHRIVLQSHTDGVSWIQDNGPVAILALTRWFASLPQSCRPSLEVLLTSGHLVQSEGNNPTSREAKRIDEEFDQGLVGGVFTLEHLGSRAIEAFPRGAGKPGRELRYDGQSEVAAISVSESQLLVDAASGAVQRSGIDRVAVLRNLGLPGTTAPPNCSPGGDNTAFWQRIVPAVQGISGPWSLFAPSFGEQSVDFGRMATQARIFADIVLAAAPQDPKVLAGNLLLYRELRAGGAPVCSDYVAGDIRNAFEPRDQAPGPGADPLRISGRAPKRLGWTRRPSITCVVTGGGAPRTCRASVVLRVGKRSLLVARGTAKVVDSGVTKVALRTTRRGRAALRRLPKRGWQVRIIVTARDRYDVAERVTLGARASQMRG